MSNLDPQRPDQAPVFDTLDEQQLLDAITESLVTMGGITESRSYYPPVDPSVVKVFETIDTGDYGDSVAYAVLENNIERLPITLGFQLSNLSVNAIVAERGGFFDTPSLASIEDVLMHAVETRPEMNAIMHMMSKVTSTVGKHVVEIVGTTGQTNFGSLLATAQNDQSKLGQVSSAFVDETFGTMLSVLNGKIPL